MDPNIIEILTEINSSIETVGIVIAIGVLALCMGLYSFTGKT